MKNFKNMFKPEKVASKLHLEEIKDIVMSVLPHIRDLRDMRSHYGSRFTPSHFNMPSMGMKMLRNRSSRRFLASGIAAAAVGTAVVMYLRNRALKKMEEAKEGKLVPREENGRTVYSIETKQKSA